MRLIDADFLKVNEAHYDEEGVRIFYENEIDNAPVIKINTNDIEYKAYCKGLEDGKKIARTQGKWIITAEDNDGVHRIQCPFCRYEKGSDFIDYITVTFERFPPFCENCGAKMDGGEEE